MTDSNPVLLGGLQATTHSFSCFAPIYAEGATSLRIVATEKDRGGSWLRLVRKLVCFPQDADELVGFKLERTALRLEVDDDLRAIPDGSDLQAGQARPDHYEIACLQICSPLRNLDRVGHAVIVAGRTRGPELVEPFPPSPFVLLQEHGAQLHESVSPDVIERPENPLAVVDCQRDHFGLEGERLLEEGACRLLDQLCEFADVLVGDLQAGEIHEGEGGTP
jgi:hypothetical protein